MSRWRTKSFSGGGGQSPEPDFESEFYGFSYGFRPGRSAHDALDALAYVVERRKVSWIVEVDIREFFGSIEREQLMQFLEMRIGDRRVLRLIRKWLNAGVMDAEPEADFVRGTPPRSADIAAACERVPAQRARRLVRARVATAEARGETYIVRYADDFVLGFQHRNDAVRFMEALRERFAAYGLELHPEKTRLLEFGRFALATGGSAGGPTETFDFLGLTHYCRTRRDGRFGLGRKPVAKRMRRTLKAIKAELRRRMHDKPVKTGQWLGRVLRGWLGYYAVPTSYRSLQRFANDLRRLWLNALRQRSQRDRFTWERLAALARDHWPRVSILHPWPTERFAVRTQGRSRMPNGHVRICAGGAG